MIDFDKLLKEKLSEEKYLHTISVASEAVKLAKQYGCDEDKAKIAGLLHDITKEYTKEQHFELFEKYNVPLTHTVRNSEKLWHAVSGAYLAKNELNIDKEIFDAIYYHTTGKEDMSLLSKIIFIADYIEPYRDFEGVLKVREIAYKDINKALRIALTQTIIEVVGKNSLLDLNTVKARNYYLNCR